MQNIFFLICRLRMHFRIAGAADAKIPLRFQLIDKVDCVMIIPSGRVLSLHGSRNIPSKRHYVFNACSLKIGYSFRNRCFRRRSAGQMRQGRYAKFITNILCNIQSVAACPTACAIRNTHKRRLQFCNLFRSGFNTFIRIRRFRREYFKR